MINEIIIAVLLILVFTGIRSGTKHFKGQGRIAVAVLQQNQDKKKKLKNIIGQKRVQIEGMTCEHCKNRVENALNRLEGVSAKVNLKKKTADCIYGKRGRRYAAPEKRLSRRGIR